MKQVIVASDIAFEHQGKIIEGTMTKKLAETGQLRQFTSVGNWTRTPESAGRTKASNGGAIT
jgi:hypothetical protein